MWMKIEDLHKHIQGRQMFVVKAFDVQPISTLADYKYTTDPCCVWYDEFASDGPFVRWKHAFMPTHFCLLPDGRE